jgi:site-specific DNA recombinase
MKRAVIYNRVSTKEQKEHGYSLDDYHDRCREYAERRDFDVISTISDSISGDKLARPGLDEVRSMVGDALIETIVVYAPDRLTRNFSPLPVFARRIPKG